MAAAAPQYGVPYYPLTTNAELMQVAFAATIADLDNPRINTGNIDDVYLTEVVNELTTLEERSVLAAFEADVIKRRAAAARNAADAAWVAATDRQSADELASQNRPYLLRALRLAKVISVLAPVVRGARAKRNGARLTLSGKTGAVDITDAMVLSFMENGATPLEDMHIPSAVARDDGNFYIVGLLSARMQLLHYSEMVARLVLLQQGWRAKYDSLVRVLRGTVYMNMTAPGILDLDTPMVYLRGRVGGEGGTPNQPIIVLPTNSGRVIMMQIGYAPHEMNRADAQIRRYREVRFYAERPSRLLLPARNSPESTLEGVDLVSTDRYSPRNIMESFPPELMLPAFPDDDRYHRFVEWYNTVATEEQKQTTDVEPFSRWYNTKSATRSMFEAFAIAHPTADTSAMGHTIARKLNAVRSRTLYASMQ